MEIRIQCLCIDTAEPARLASFWASALGWRQTWSDDDQVCLEPPAGSPEDGIIPDLVFLRVPDSKTRGFLQPSRDRAAVSTRQPDSPWPRGI